MYKIKILAPCTLPVFEKGKTENRVCAPGEEVEVAEIAREDIESNIYVPYRKEIVGSDNAPIKRQRPQKKQVIQNDAVDQIVQATNILRDAVNNASNVLSNLANISKNIAGNNDNGKTKIITGSTEENGIPDELFINEGDEIETPYSAKESIQHREQMSAAISNSIFDASDKNRAATLPNVTHKQSVFHKFREGTAKIIEETPVIARPEKIDDSPIKIVENSQGNVDVVKTLGMEVVGA